MAYIFKIHQVGQIENPKWACCAPWAVCLTTLLYYLHGNEQRLEYYSTVHLINTQNYLFLFFFTHLHSHCFSLKKNKDI